MEQFALIPNKLISEQQLNKIAKRIYMILSVNVYQNFNGHIVTMTKKLLAEILQTDNKTINKNLDQLASLSYIKSVEGTGGHRNNPSKFEVLQIPTKGNEIEFTKIERKRIYNFSTEVLDKYITIKFLFNLTRKSNKLEDYLVSNVNSPYLTIGQLVDDLIILRANDVEVDFTYHLQINFNDGEENCLKENAQQTDVEHVEIDFLYDEKPTSKSKDMSTNNIQNITDIIKDFYKKTNNKGRYLRSDKAHIELAKDNMKVEQIKEVLNYMADIKKENKIIKFEKCLQEFKIYRKVNEQGAIESLIKRFYDGIKSPINLSLLPSNFDKITQAQEQNNLSFEQCEFIIDWMIKSGETILNYFPNKVGDALKAYQKKKGNSSLYDQNKKTIEEQIKEKRIQIGWLQDDLLQAEEKNDERKIKEYTVNILRLEEEIKNLERV